MGWTECCLGLVLLLRNKRLSICTRRWRDRNCTFASGLFLNYLCLDKHRPAFLGFLPIWSGGAPCHIGKTSTGLHRRMNKKNGLLSRSGEKSLTGFQVHRAPWRKCLSVGKRPFLALLMVLPPQSKCHSYFRTKPKSSLRAKKAGKRVLICGQSEGTSKGRWLCYSLKCRNSSPPNGPIWTSSKLRGGQTSKIFQARCECS